jgi:hypothetical protein
MIKWIKSFFHKKDKEQMTFVYCKCGNEMCSDNSFVSDTYDEKGDNHVKYKCEKCGCESDFNFDIAPCPISWEELRGKV